MITKDKTYEFLRSFSRSKTIDLLTGNTPARTDLKSSVESHLMGIAAETSRFNGGAPVKVHE